LAVQEDDVLEVQDFATAADLPEPGDPWLGVEPAEVVVLLFLEVGLEERPGSDE